MHHGAALMFDPRAEIGVQTADILFPIRVNVLPHSSPIRGVEKGVSKDKGRPRKCPGQLCPGKASIYKKQG